VVISIIRKASANGCTLSNWYVDGQPQCVGIEDVVRGPAELKVHGKTAIPAGTYQVKVTFSNRFQRLLPELSDMPGKRTLFGDRLIGNCGVRIHPGNYATDTEGCLLPGTSTAGGGTMVTNSRVAFEALFAKINRALERQEPITLTIR
jgi:hypothetical protein